MKCDEVQTLHGPYLDSELDAKTTLEIEQHLKACSACARLFAEEEKLEARVMAGLKQGPRTAALWDRVERSVLGVAPLQPEFPEGRENLTPRRRESQRGAEGSFSLRSSAFLCVSALNQFRAAWQRSRWAWAGLAAVWVVILVLNSAAREPNPPLVAGQDLPSASEMRLALKQKDLLMAELAFFSEPAAKPKPVPPSPRSDRRRATFNT
jgi:anti-sigma factor RsiW